MMLQFLLRLMTHPECDVGGADGFALLLLL